MKNAISIDGIAKGFQQKKVIQPMSLNRKKRNFWFVRSIRMRKDDLD